MATLVSQAEFARNNGWARSYVTALKQAGRLVMTDDGKKVRVEESLARIEATRDPNRDDVADRHDKNRHAEEREAGDYPFDPSADESKHNYQLARAKKEFYLAKQAEAEYEERIGKLVAADDVKRAFRAQATQLRISMDHMRDQISAELAAETDQDAIHAMLGEHFEAVQAEVCRGLGEMAGKNVKGDV